MPTFGVTGRVYRKAWRVSAPRPRQWSSCTASASTRALYHWLGNALNGAGTDCGRDKISYGLTKGDLRLRQSIVRVRQLRPAPLRHRPRPARRIRSRPLRSNPAATGGWSQHLKPPSDPGRFRAGRRHTLRGRPRLWRVAHCRRPELIVSCPWTASAAHDNGREKTWPHTGIFWLQDRRAIWKV